MSPLATRLFGAALIAVALAAPLGAATETREVAIIVDTSGSMDTSDRERYTLQLTQIVGDLLEDADGLTVIRMPGGEHSCSPGPDPRLALRLDPADRAGFKRALDHLLVYDTGTYFAAAIETAIQTLERTSRRRRMLLIIADSGGMGGCAGDLTRALSRQRQQGTFIAAVNLGGTSGAFDRNPAFDVTSFARNANELIEAVAEVYQRFLGAKKVQTGRVRGAIEVEIAPLASRAFLVVAADGPIGRLSQGQGNPGAHRIDLDYRGGGRSVGLDQVTRSYKIVRLDRPASGRWRFQASELQATAGWLLIQEFTLALRQRDGGPVPEGTPVLLEVEIYDTETGKVVKDVPDLSVDFEVDGRRLSLRDDGSGGDRKARDGIFSAEVELDRAGRKVLDGRITNDLLDQKVQISLDVVELSWQLTAPRLPECVVAGVPIEIEVGARALTPAASGAGPPERLSGSDGSASFTLQLDAGGGQPRYRGRWTPARPGPARLAFTAARVQLSGGEAEADVVPVSFSLDPGRLPDRVALGIETEVALRAEAMGEMPRSLEIRIGGQAVTLLDDGSGGDAGAGDGVFTARWTPAAVGRQPLSLPGSGACRRLGEGEIEVLEGGWDLEVQTPARTAVEVPALLAVALREHGEPGLERRAPDSVRAGAGGAEVELRDDGSGGDLQAGDRIYSATWSPPAAGAVTVTYAPRGGVGADPVRRDLEVRRAGWTSEVSADDFVELGAENPLRVILRRRDPELEGHRPPERIRVSLDGAPVAELTAGGPPADEMVFTGAWTADRIGGYTLGFTPVGGLQVDVPEALPVEVRAAGWRLEVVEPADTVELDTVTRVRVRLEEMGSEDLTREPPETIVMAGAGAELVLHDDGSADDADAGDRVYEAVWTPAALGPLDLSFTAAGGSLAKRTGRRVEVVGRLELSSAAPVEIGPASSQTEAEASLELTVNVKGEHQLNLSTDFRSKGARLEIHDGAAWRPLAAGVSIAIDTATSLAWPLRLRADECPRGSDAGTAYRIVVEGAGVPGVRLEVPLAVVVEKDPWLHCWWRTLATIAAALVLLWVVYGIWSPSRFAPRLGVMLSPEEDMDEGFLHPIRAQRGTGSGFYRDAHAYVCEDFRIAGRSRGALAQLRAEGSHVRIRPATGAEVFWQTADGDWDRLPAQEIKARFGVVYRNARNTLFFELRNR